MGLEQLVFVGPLQARGSQPPGACTPPSLRPSQWRPSFEFVSTIGQSGPQEREILTRLPQEPGADPEPVP